jgi:ferrous iron transport protein B
VILAVLTAILFKKTILKPVDYPFVMELPPYKIPSIKALTNYMIDRAIDFLKKIGGIILIASVIIWGLGYFPRNISYSLDYDKATATIEAKYAELAKQWPVKNTLLQTEKEKEFNALMAEKGREQQEKSYIGQIGKIIEPVLRPAGFDWKMSTTILTAIPGKEIVTSSLGILYEADLHNKNNKTNLIEKLRSQIYTSGPKTGQKVFTPLVALSFMLFILIYFPCVGVIVTIYKETASWKWAAFSVLYSTGLAWLVSVGVYQVGSLFF